VAGCGRDAGLEAVALWLAGCTLPWLSSGAWTRRCQYEPWVHVRDV